MPYVPTAAVRWGHSTARQRPHSVLPRRFPFLTA
ncbi:hypothetical protein Ae356Ps1_6055 [Pseudonocardia sp. Ae356_Ps1]|nr:hypothetical protein Ae356Ps1_6047 [Pseudonocardia sp. Ae356_Ps1]OLL89311.1 hypothetical protein Ae356Ps1_6055 [Pseudonocardia sp. Ae356_Ps1]